MREVCVRLVCCDNDSTGEVMESKFVPNCDSNLEVVRLTINDIFDTEGVDTWHCPLLGWELSIETNELEVRVARGLSHALVTLECYVTTAPPTIYFLRDKSRDRYLFEGKWLAFEGVIHFLQNP